MPKAILEFKLPEEKEEFDLARKGAHYSCVIEDLDNFLRGKIKYSNLEENIEAIYQEVRDKLNELRYGD